jgi:hypothetical protein
MVAAGVSCLLLIRYERIGLSGVQPDGAGFSEAVD